MSFESLQTILATGGDVVQQRGLTVTALKPL